MTGWWRGLAVTTALIACTVAILWANRFQVRESTPSRPGAPRTGLHPETRSIGVNEASQSKPRFTDVAKQANLIVPHIEGADGLFRLVETMGSGVGFIDIDGDGWQDLVVSQGCTLGPDRSSPAIQTRLYRNQRNGTFVDVTERAGLRTAGYGQGIAVGDYDNDGDDDLYLSAFGRGSLHRNEGDGTFRDVTEMAGIVDEGWGTSCAFADLDGDGDLDLYVAHYLAGTVDAQGRPTVQCQATPGRLGYCPPSAFRPEPDALFRNNGDGTFRDVSRESGIAAAGGNGLGLAIADWDDDGRLDIFVANDQSPNFLFRNLGGMRFEEVALGWGLAYNESGELRAGMGVACGDYDGDGRTDLYVTNFYEETNTLYRNLAPGRFQVTTTFARLAVPSRSKLGFGTGFFDYDNDGRLDLFVANGHINDVRPLGMPYAMEPQVFRNTGGRFADMSAAAGPYFAGHWLGRGAAFGDIDNDGDTDIIVTHLGRPPALLKNETASAGMALTLRFAGKGPARRPAGARVTATLGGTRLVREATAGGSYLSSSDPRLQIGVGKASKVDRLEIHWPTGKSRSWSNLEAGQPFDVQPPSESP